MNTMNEWSKLSALDLAERVRTRRVTSEHLIETHIETLTRVNPGLNAMVADRFDAARAESRAADKVLADITDPRDLPPLHGVPCSIKESFALTGMPNSAGLVSRRHHRAPTDAPTVARLRAAGAIPLGVSNTSELCMWMESDNEVYGRTNNPYDLTRTVGGSSGGEGALVGAGLVPFGLGSDVGGSIRMPAFFNGVFGHKPTGTMVPGSGQYPSPSGIVWRMLSTGPITRRAADLFPILQILAGPDPGDPFSAPCILRNPADVDIQTLTVWDVRDTTLIPPSDELLAAQERAAEALSRRGARVRRVSIPEFGGALEAWAARMHVGGGPSFAELLGEGHAIAPWRELVQCFRGRSPHTIASVGLALVEKLPDRFPQRNVHALALGERLKARVHGLLGDNAVMLRPSYTHTAPRHGWALALPVQWGYTAAFNALESPVTQVPLGLGRGGLPLGVQVAGPLGRDDLTLAVALALEESLGGWTPPPPVSHA